MGTEHRVAAAALGGIVAVQVASLLGFWLRGFGLSELDFNTANGAVYLPQATHIQQFLVGGLSHYIDGAVFALISRWLCRLSCRCRRRAWATLQRR